MKLTAPRAIVIGSIIIALAIIFRIDDVNSETGGINHPDFRNAVWAIMDDYHSNFHSAVENIIEDCSVEDSYIYC